MQLIFPILAWASDLQWYWVCSAGVFFLLLFWREQSLRKQDKARMETLETGAFYLEQLLLSFAKNYKVTAALADILLVTEGTLWCRVKSAMNCLDRGWKNASCYEEAFQKIEQTYGFPLMHKVHCFLTTVEAQGGECDDVFSLLIVQLKDWMAQQKKSTEKGKEIRGKLLLMTSLSAFISFAVTKVAPAGTGLNTNPMYQWSMGLGYLLLEAVYGGFLHVGRIRTYICLEDTKQDYDKLWQTRRGLNRNKLTKAVQEVFPLFMMDMVLYLQTESVAVAIAHAAETAPQVLRYPLTLMKAEMEKDPLSREPFDSFLAPLEIPESKALMQRLYNIRRMGKTQIHEQILALLEQQRILEASVAELRMENRCGLAGLMAMLPMGLTVLLSLWNMSLILTGFLSKLTEVHI